MSEYPCPYSGTIHSTKMASVIAWRWCQWKDNCKCRQSWPEPTPTTSAERSPESIFALPPTATEDT